MYLSHLLIDTGDNPDRPRPGRLWLRNLYHVHQRLCMGFPSSERKSADKLFLQPYKPNDFAQGHVHVERREGSGFLFRIDPLSPGRAAILVQSAAKPGWEYAFRNAGYLLAARPELREFNPSFEPGQRLRFRLLANPTKKTATIRKEDRERLTREERQKTPGRNGRRVPVPSAEALANWRKANPGADPREFISQRLLGWLDAKARASGFILLSTVVQPAYAYWHKRPSPMQEQAERRDDTGRRRAALFEGMLAVADPARFRDTLIHGIGPGKAFGFGLLSVAPCHNSPAPEST